MNVSNTQASHSSKVPEIMLGFWIVKIFATTVCTENLI
jgi:uncharacterized membrane-anchored protein